ncbi:MAG: LAGLIDADG family homing endonuclease [Candidatus Woesearchaeota archaeon]
MKVQIPNEPTINLAEEFGIHIGDGSMNFYKEKGLVSIAINPNEKKYMDFIKRLYWSLYKVSVNLRNWSRAYGFQLSSNELVEFKYKQGLPLGKKENINIPHWIKKNEQYQKACLRGIFDTDGTLYIEKKYNKPYPRIQISSISQNLIKDIHEILVNLDFKVSLWKENFRNKNWKTRHVIALRGYKQVQKWMDEIGTNNPKNLEKYNKLIFR